MNDFGLGDQHREQLYELFASMPEIEAVYVFGSRARGDYTKTSDVDLAVKFADAEKGRLSLLSSKLEDLPIIYKFDAVDLANIKDEFKADVERDKKLFYRKGWRWTTLGEVIETNKHSITNDYQQNEILYLDTGSITEGKIDVLQRLSFSEAPSRARRLVEHGDIVYSTVRPIQRHYGFIENPPNDFVVSTGFTVISCKKGKADSKFIYYFLMQNEVVETLDLVANGATSTYPSIKPTDIENLEIFLPNIEEQRSIAAVLSSLDDKIELLREENRTLEAIAQTLFKEWFVDFNFPNKNGHPYKNSGGKMINSKLGLIPERWRTGKLGDILSLEYGKTLKEHDRSGAGFPVIGSGGIVGYHKDFLIEGPGIVVGRKGNAGCVSWIHHNFYPIDTSFFVADQLGIGQLYWHFLTLKQVDFSKVCADSAVPGLNRNIAHSMEIVIPPMQLMQLFNNSVDGIFSKQGAQSEQIDYLSKNRDTLISPLLAGDLYMK